MRDRAGRRWRHLHLAALTLVLAALPAPAFARRALVVFGSTVRPDGRPGPSLERRLQKTLEVANADPGCLLVVSGGTRAGPAEAPVMARWLSRRGVARSRIVVEPLARNTRENADLVVPLLRGAGIDQVTLITDRYHTRRAGFQLRSALSRAKLPVQLETCAVPDGLRGPARLKVWLRESARIVRDASLRLRDRLTGR